VVACSCSSSSLQPSSNRMRLSFCRTCPSDPVC
jgi:hypothetical protein